MKIQDYIQALGPLASLYQDPEVTEIMVDAFNKVIVDRNGKLVDAGVKFSSPAALRSVIDATLALGGVTLSQEQTSGHIRFPDASRMLAVIPPTAVDGPYLVLRKTNSGHFSMADLIGFGSITDFPANIGNTIGNTDLEPQQTIMYEIGLQQQLSDDIGITLTGYYKDIRNLLGTEIHIKNEFKKFSKLINIDYGSVKGITFSFEKRFSHGIGTTIDYTFQSAQGNASDPNDEYEKAQASPPIESNKQLVPLNWDQTHSLNFTITGGIPGDFIASCIGRLGSGLPYTPAVQNQRTGLENSDRRPTKFNVDLFVTKYFLLFGQQASVFLKVYNLFDTANEVDVFSDTGRAGYSLEVTRNQEPPRGVNTIEEYYTRPDFYSAPRQILLGASFAF